MKYKIAILSHRRSGIILDKTLKVLKDIDKELIYIFVSDEQDVKDYKEALPDYNIVYETPLNDLKEKHNFIIDYFGDDERVVFFEDDIEKVIKKKGTKTEEFTGDLELLFKIGFNECVKEKTKLWGIEPTGNGFYMKNAHQKSYKLVVAYMFGMIIDKRLKVTSAWKHDYERTILHSIYFGGAVRFDMFGAKTNSFKNKGGLQSELNGGDRAKKETESVKYLMKKYPGYIDYKIRAERDFDSCRQIDATLKRPKK
jgi:hypothetical protein